MSSSKTPDTYPSDMYYPVLAKSQIPTVALIMALQKEEDALLKVLNAPEDADEPCRIEKTQVPSLPLSSNSYDCWRLIKKSDGTPLIRIVSVTLAEMGPVSAAAATSQLLFDWHPDVVLLLGICAGIPGSDPIRLGDLVLAERIVDHESGKYTVRGLEQKFPQIGCDTGLLVGMRRFGSSTYADVSRCYRRSLTDIEDKYQCHIGGNKYIRENYDIHMARIRSGQSAESHDLDVHVHCGTMLSGSTVVKSLHVREDLRTKVPNVKALEMEGAGVAAVLKRLAEAPRFIALKGVCDFADESKDDRWQDVAAILSADFAISYLKHLGTDEARALCREPKASKLLRGRIPWHYTREGANSEWQRTLIARLSQSVADECDDILDGTYTTTLSQSHQYVLRATSLFSCKDPDQFSFFVSAIDKVSSFWLESRNSSELREFLGTQRPGSVYRLFVFTRSGQQERIEGWRALAKWDGKRRIKKHQDLQAIYDVLDEHYAQYKNVYLCHVQPYIERMHDIFWHSKDDAQRIDFAVRARNSMIESGEKDIPKDDLVDEPLIWWLDRQRLHICRCTQRNHHKIPIDHARFVERMIHLIPNSQDSSRGFYRWCEDEDQNWKFLQSIAVSLIEEKQKPTDES